LIVSVRNRETKQQKEDRIKITNTRTKFVSQQIKSIWDEVERADNAVETIRYKENIREGSEYAMRLIEQMEGFTIDEDMRAYLHNKLKHLNFIDPNAFIILEFEPSEDEDPHIYPIIAYSNQVMDYDFGRKQLQYLHIRHEWHKYVIEGRGVNQKVVKEPAFKHYFYSPDVSWTMTELGKEGKYKLPSELEDQDFEIVATDEKEPTHYALQVFVHSTGVTPAVQAGYIFDDETDQNTKVSILDAAENIYTDLINTKSEYDISKALHGFYKQYAYGNVCSNSAMIDGRRYVCNDGMIGDQKCTECEGHGLILHSSPQDVILIKRPNDKEEHIPLSQMVHYVQIPEHIMARQKKELEELEKKVVEAIFNHIPFDQSQVASTATEKRLMREGVYNKFEAFGKNYSRVYKQLVDITARHLMIDEGLVVQHHFKKDWHLESLEELITMRKAAEESGVPYQVIEKLDFNILQKQSQDSPEELEWQTAMNKFKPFKGKTESEIAILLNQLPNLSRQRNLYIFFDEVIERIRNSDDPNVNRFPEFPYERQNEIIISVLDQVVLENNITEEIEVGGFED
jgi:hypothetical protein